MATIKSYTDLEQSRKLAEILPPERADMYYLNRTDMRYQGAFPIECKLGNHLLSQKIPCWSLAALLDNIPQAKLESVKVKKRDKTRWKCYSFFDVVIQSDLVIDWYVSDWCDNPVDACYDVIFQLHKKTNI